MATSAYLGDYSILNENTVFSILFQIPDNCYYKFDEDTNGVYTISVFLNPSIKKPSKTFVTKSEIITCDQSNNVEVGFLLPEEGGIGLAKKPKLSVNA